MNRWPVDRIQRVYRDADESEFCIVRWADTGDETCELYATLVDQCPNAVKEYWSSYWTRQDA